MDNPLRQPLLTAAPVGSRLKFHSSHVPFGQVKRRNDEKKAENWKRAGGGSSWAEGTRPGLCDLDGVTEDFQNDLKIYIHVIEFFCTNILKF